LSVRLVILADDLTGALDTAEPFARAGASAVVATSLAAARGVAVAGHEVVAINVDSRRLARDAAIAAMREAWRLIAPWAPDHLFKKIDSRMKGHVGAELAALMALGERERAIVAPAIPAIGRLVGDGAVIGFGVARPVRIADLPDWQAAWDVPDCPDESAMARIANLILSEPTGTMAVGASGLAEAMAARFLFDRGTVAPPPPSRAGPLLMAIGSRDPITLGQIAALEQHRRTRADADLFLLRAPLADDDSSDVAGQLAARALAFARDNAISTLLLSGGDTAAAFIRAAGIDLLVPSGALAPGMPVARGEAGDGRVFTLITKSGGFGDPETLVKAATHWRDT
jgi:uncharacterized protein YgbK (DUF1537 family)